MKSFYIIIILFQFFAFQSTISGQDSMSKNISVSLITHGPGQELYSTFGHSALKIINDTHVVVYNYGTFNFNEPDFYSNFVLGKLNYYLNVEDISYYFDQYQQENRSSREIVLNTNSAENTVLSNLLIENAKEENKFYRYDFIFNNCSSKIIQLLKRSYPNLTLTESLNPLNKSYRELILERYTENKLNWVGLGVNILLGKKCDAIPNNEQICFIPDYLEKYLKNAKNGSIPMAASYQTVTPQIYQPIENSFFLSPIFIIAAFSFLWFIAPKQGKVSQVFQIITFLTLGLLGVIILFLGGFTEHQYFSSNYNLLWASPIYIVYLFSNSNWKTKLAKWIRFGLSFVLIFKIIHFYDFPTEILPLLFTIYYKLINPNFKIQKNVFSFRS